MKRIFLSTLLLVSAHLFSQNIEECAWSNASYWRIWKTYFRGDSATARCHVKNLNISVINDTASPLLRMEPKNDLTCTTCRIMTFDSKGRLTSEINNYIHPNEVIYKDVLAYDDNESRPKYKLRYSKKLSITTETDFELETFILYSNFEYYTISSCYPSNNAEFSTKPLQKPLWTRTQIYDDKKRIINDKTVSTDYDSPFIDSTIYHYGTDGSMNWKYYSGNEIVQVHDEVLKSGMIATEYDSVYQSRLTRVVNYNYSGNRVRSATVKGRTESDMQSCNDNSASAASVTYNDKGLPLMIVYKTGGDYCAIVFQYSYY